MKTKLTLSIEPELVLSARQQARNENNSVSGIFSDFIRDRQMRDEEMFMRNLDAMTGSLKGFAVDDSKVGIRKAYAKKYLG